MEQVIALPLSDPDLLRQALLIDGQWLQAESGETLEVRNPATGALIAHVPKARAAKTGEPLRRQPVRCQPGAPNWRRSAA